MTWFALSSLYFLHSVAECRVGLIKFFSVYFITVHFIPMGDLTLFYKLHLYFAVCKLNFSGVYIKIKYDGYLTAPFLHRIFYTMQLHFKISAMFIHIIKYIIYCNWKIIFTESSFWFNRTYNKAKLKNCI